MKHPGSADGDDDFGPTKSGAARRRPRKRMLIMVDRDVAGDVIGGRRRRIVPCVLTTLCLKWRGDDPDSDPRRENN